jgi:integrase
VPVDALTRGDIQRLVDEIASEQTAEHARKALTALRVVLRDAIRYGDVEQNPCAGVCTPTSGEPERAARFLTPEEAASVLAAAQAEDERRRRSLAAPMIALAVGSGLRLGEQLSLPWGPTGLDLDAGVVRVRRNMDSVRDELGAYRFVSPKSRRGIRDVPLSPSDVALLRRHRLASGRPEDGDLVFSDELGRSLEPKNTARRILSRGCKKAGIAAPQPRWHDLRHSYASAQLAAGLSVHAVAHLIGDTPEMVWRRYGHALPDEVAGAGTALEEFRRSRGL